METAQTSRLLVRLAQGDEGARAELLPLVYLELREVAARLMAGERRDHTLQPTALVHEAWMRLSGSDAAAAGGRELFLGLAAQAMRRVLIDHARRRGARKRGDGGERLPLDEALDGLQEGAPDLLALDEALGRLEAVDPQLVRIVEQRFFAAAGNDEIAASLGVSTRTVERGWRTAQAWLRNALEPPAESPSP